MPAIEELAKTEPDVEIQWRAFELRPEPVPLPDATSDFFTNIWEQSIYPLADELGVKIKMPKIKPRSRIAHQAAKWAESKGKFKEFRNSLFRTYFEEGLDLGKKETVISLARSLDLDGDSLSNALYENQFLELVLADQSAAAELGLNGVPAYIANRKTGMMGIQSLEDLRKLVESLRT